MSDVMDRINAYLGVEAAPALNSKQLPAALRWWPFHQNNSRAFFRAPAHEVWVQAFSKEEAVALAEEVGVYFGYRGNDCPCCGERWCEPWDDEGAEAPFQDVAGEQQNVLCEELPERGAEEQHFHHEGKQVEPWTRYITMPQAEPWTADDVENMGPMHGKTLLLRAHNGARAYCRALTFHDATTYGN
jgi:hypothetical protein